MSYIIDVTMTIWTTLFSVWLFIPLLSKLDTRLNQLEREEPNINPKSGYIQLMNIFCISPELYHFFFSRDITFPEAGECWKVGDDSAVPGDHATLRWTYQQLSASEAQ